MTDISIHLNALSGRLTQLGRPVVGILEPGTPDEGVRAVLGEAPDEVREWFGWCGGTSHAVGQTIDQASFIPGYVFPSMREALDVKAEAGNPPSGFLDWIPVLLSGGYDFYAAAWDGNGNTYVLGVLLGEPVEVEYESLGEMVSVFTAAIDRRAFFVDEIGEFSMDPVLFDEVYQSTTGRSLG